MISRGDGDRADRDMIDTAQDSNSCAADDGRGLVVRGHDTVSSVSVAGLGFDTLGLACRDYRLRDPSQWKHTEETDGKTGEVVDRPVRPREWEEGFRYGESEKNGKHLWFRFDAGLGRERNTELMWDRLRTEVPAGLAARFDALGIEADVEGLFLTRVDFAVDTRFVGTGGSVQAVNDGIRVVSDRIQIDRYFEQSLDLPNSKRWWTGAGAKESEHPRVVRLYNRMLKGGDPGDPVARMEVAWNGKREVERAFGIKTLGELAYQLGGGLDAFLKVVGPALPEPAPVESDVEFDYHGLARHLGYSSHKIGLALQWYHLQRTNGMEQHLDAVGESKSANAKSTLRSQLNSIAPIARAFLTPNRNRDLYAAMRRALSNPLPAANALAA